MKEFLILVKDGKNIKKRYYSIKESAEFFGVSYPTINRWVKTKAIKASRFGRAIYIEEDEIIKLQNDCLQGKVIGENNE
ncbi:DNA-binding protein [Campylobacter sp. MIT 12-8780]|uniref:helix-turn-helix domain-containing protein n=1 Tax=unclassified Campylobacter TaxID=2593542 RepID=UPI000512F904|nr:MULTISPECIES: helix-turn-helix domain-containing protein [unclassified Campylobacter]KGI56033.1 hypothetical protein LR59_09105 [Campylobacter sp. MIT 97-5078]KGI57463.1 hypothetical protein LR59_01795 [Campylobacter sp. MIT 97-5078]KGI57508.1 hypothetical protein LR59_02100 [Campylobacter sp. MIT 97-5078]NDJ27673.1 helix-turn-helix domain-containing protein [Campylobacter sp. MIT 19-121]TQR27387.1 DNA-binding protein [Campylobacter sp. MIT 97-5078]